MTSHCKDCEHFTEGFEYEEWGCCDMADSHNGEQQNKKSLAVAGGIDGWESWLLVKSNFGCIQFEAKDNV